MESSIKKGEIISGMVDGWGARVQTAVRFGAIVSFLDEQRVMWTRSCSSVRTVKNRVLFNLL